mgnify:CR=1 FL=1
MHPRDFCQRLRAEASKLCAMRQYYFHLPPVVTNVKEKWLNWISSQLFSSDTIHEHRRVLVIQCSLGRHFVTSTQYGTNLIMGDNWRSLPLRNGLSLCLPSSQQVKQFPADSPATQLVQVLKETDPDDSFSSVPYEKGSCFLYYLEQILGGPGFKILLSIQYSPEIRSKEKREANRTYILLCAHQCKFIFALFPDLMPTFQLLLNQRLGPMKWL